MSPFPSLRHAVVVALAALALTACIASTEPLVTPQGEPASAKTQTLKAGAVALQTRAPLEPMHVYLVGFHPMKEAPGHQMIAHHFCRQVNEDFAQCVLFDGNTREANLTGIEFIISERLFAQLPAAERAYWHPHNGEILSGQLVAPGLPATAERELMKTKLNSYGKTWHVWMTDQGDRLPTGPAMLAWSFSREGEVDPALAAQRDRELGVDTAAKRAQRQDLVPLARPQEGVDTLAGAFGRATQPIPGVVEAPRRADR
jgi:hypothetical protein